MLSPPLNSPLGPSNMKIRKAEEKDIPVLVDLWWQMHTFHYKYDKEYYQLLPKRKACHESQKHLQTMLANENTIFLVAEAEGVLLGSLLAHIDHRPPVFSTQKRILVDHVVVDEKHRCKGIFSKLQNRLDSISKQKGAILIELNVDVSNPAVDVYKKKGYFSVQYKMVKKLK